MAFESSKGRYASFGVVTNLPGQVIDSIWYIIDHYLKGVFPLTDTLQFELLNKKGMLALRFSQKGQTIKVIVDTQLSFDPFYPHKLYVLDRHKRQTVLLADELELF